MYRYFSILFGTALIGVSVFALMTPLSPLSIIMDTSVAGAVLRVAFAILLIAYSVSALLRYDFFRDLLLFSGLAGLSYLFVSLYTDSFAFPKPVDLFFILQGATLSIIATVDFARPKQVQRFLPHITVLELLLARLRKIDLPTTAHSSEHKPAKA